MCADCWLSYIQEFEVPVSPLDKDSLVYIRERTAGFIMDQVIKPTGQFHIDDATMAEMLNSELNKWYDASDV